MKNLIVLALLIMFSNTQAKPCQTMDLSIERVKLERFVTFSDKEISQFMGLKTKLKRAQIMSCLDQVLAGQEVSFLPEDHSFALEVLRSLEQETFDSEMKEDIKFLFKALES